MRISDAAMIASLLILTGTATAQGSQPASQPMTLPSASAAFSASIDAAHGGDAWRSHTAVQMEIRIEMGGSVAIDGQMMFTTDMSRVRMDLADGTVVIWNGEAAHVSPASSEFAAARFHVLTWPYFAAAPFKLDDPGTALTIGPRRPFHGEMHPSARLTFGEDVGDAPDDWYVIYREPETETLCAMAYIVTYFRGGATGEEEPHAIAYSEPVEVDGVVFPTRWDFLLWSEDEGPHGEPMGHAEISDIVFVAPAPDAFTVPADSREDTPPRG